MGSVLRSSIVLLTVAVVTATLFSRSDGKQESKAAGEGTLTIRNLDHAHADGLHAQDPRDSGKLSTSDQPGQNKRQTTVVFSVKVYTAEDTDTVNEALSFKLVNPAGVTSDSINLPPPPYGAGSWMVTPAYVEGQGTGIQSIEVTKRSGTDWHPLYFKITTGSLTNICPWAILCQLMTTTSPGSWACPYNVATVASIPCFSYDSLTDDLMSRFP